MKIRVVRLLAHDGGYSGGQAEYLPVPHAHVGPIKIESVLKDEQVLFLSDIFPTGYMAAENAQIEVGDTVAIWGCGPVGQFAIRSAQMLGAGHSEVSEAHSIWLEIGTPGAAGLKASKGIALLFCSA